MSWFRGSDKAEKRPSPDPARLTDVVLAYRLILKRQPDDGGLTHYRERIRQGLTLDELIAELMTSSERQGRASAGAQAPLVSNDPRGQEAAAGLIDPKEMIRRYSVEDFNVTSDEYYRRMSDPSPLLRKPFSSIDEAPEMLQNLGALLGGLNLGAAMTVLDFGAGTCWLSRFIAQMNCAVIACDPSAAALDLGRRLFAEHPPLGDEVVPPRFLHFDGHHLELEDESVDRIICFDAFHHVPNQAEVLAEFGRVLRQGGVAGFSEPGRFHSRTPQSQWEMKNYRVLENDISLNEVFGLAQPAGFTRLSVTMQTDFEISLEEYNDIFDSANSNFALRDGAWERIHDTMLSRSVFFLHKGEIRHDSRAGVGLAHRMSVEPTLIESRASGRETLRFTITNTGTAVWLHRDVGIFGVVRLAGRLYAPDGALLNLDYFRSFLPRDVAAGETIEITASVPIPAQRPSMLVFDLVAEGVRWFENEGSRTVQVRVF